MERDISLLELQEFKIVLAHEILLIYGEFDFIQNCMLPREHYLKVTKITNQNIRFKIRTKQEQIINYCVSWQNYIAEKQLFDSIRFS